MNKILALPFTQLVILEQILCNFKELNVYIKVTVKNNFVANVHTVPGYTPGYIFAHNVLTNIRRNGLK